MLPMPSFLSRSATRILAVLLLFFLVQQFLQFRQPTIPRVGNIQSSKKPSCEGLKGLEDVFVILRTGATEAPKKLPPHFTTTLQCAPHYVLFSDYEEDIDGHHVYNSLDEVNPEIVKSHQDFAYYRKLQANGRAAFTEQEIDQWTNAKNTMGGRDSPGWRLDKWKFLPVADKSFRIQPNAKWYIFIESDTFVLWKSMLDWLSHYDAEQPWYLGMQMQIGDVVFGYGGAGFAVSNSAMAKVVQYRKENLKYYDDFTAGHWAGDCILGKALQDSGVKLQWSYPSLFGDAPGDADFNSTFGGADKRPWCYHASSYHHLPAAEYPVFSEFEAKWNAEHGTLLRHRDVFLSYVKPHMRAERPEWDNSSEDIQESSDGTFASCREICQGLPECKQFSLLGKICRTSTVLKLGKKTSNAPAERVTSGWMMDRVDNYVQEMDATCSTQDWIKP
ncbi:hypothetical protein F4778DRAFT_262996 [Xylariomycetidae sp. FL2044]|nr:hypothetical protein F4778DRAFT_262996 [Xylariomycetidae sp. FL2044]